MAVEAGWLTPIAMMALCPCFARRVKIDFVTSEARGLA